MDMADTAAQQWRPQLIGGYTVLFTWTGAALSALGLPLSASQHPTILGIEAGLTAIFGSAPADVATFSDISSAVAA